MEFRLTFAHDGSEKDAGSSDFADCASSLYRWLVADPELRGHAEITVVPSQTRPGHMGDALEIVNVVLSNTIALSSLLVAVATWRGTRPRPTEVRLERDGVTVTVRDPSPDLLDRILNTGDEDDSERSPDDEGAE